MSPDLTKMAISSIDAFDMLRFKTGLASFGRVDCSGKTTPGHVDAEESSLADFPALICEDVEGALVTVELSLRMCRFFPVTVFSCVILSKSIRYENDPVLTSRLAKERGDVL